MVSARRCPAILLLALVLAGAAARAQSPEEIFERANAAYEAGRYDEAAQGYRSLLRYDVHDPRVEYNLGNAEFRAGRLGPAILHYERALRLDPTDPDIRANLELARSMRADRVEEPAQPLVVHWVRAAQERVGPDRQAWLLVALVWIAGGIVAWCTARPGGWSAPWGWTLATVLLAGTVVAASWYATHRRLAGRDRVVVLDAVVEVLAGPGGSNPSLATVHEGLTVELVGERDEWFQVRLPNGFNGWLPRASAEVI